MSPHAAPFSSSLLLPLFFFYFLLLPSPSLQLLTSSDCTWPDGSSASDHSPCNPSADRSICCLPTEICLQNNLCFGGVGLMYRSACAGGWDANDNTTCPTYCSSITPSGWANIWACPGQGDQGATEFWCGEGAVCDTSVSIGVEFFAIDNYDFKGATIIGGEPSATALATGAASVATVTVTSTAATATVTETGAAALDGATQPGNTTVACPANHDVAVGAGVGIPLALLAVSAAAWALLERRRHQLPPGAPSYYAPVATRDNKPGWPHAAAEMNNHGEAQRRLAVELPQ